MNLFEKLELADTKSAEFEQLPPEPLLEWAVQQFPKLTLACSFGAEDVVLVDMLQKIKPNADVFYLDTNFHFKETYDTRDRLSARYGMTFIQVQPSFTPNEQAQKFGDRLWDKDPNLCCDIRKVQPLTRMLGKYEAWMTGIRRDQTPARANAKKVEYDTRFGLIKLNPLADWSMKDVWDYIHSHNVIYNPLHDHNYPSIGCTYCTRPVTPDEDPRSGRWSGINKTECGLHLDVKSGEPT